MGGGARLSEDGVGGARVGKRWWWGEGLAAAGRAVREVPYEVREVGDATGVGGGAPRLKPLDTGFRR